MTPEYLKRPGKPSLGYVYTGSGGKSPLVMFCGGYRSDMTGTKATYLESRCKARGQSFLRFDYSGHGISEGRFEDGSITAWKEDALDIMDALAGDSVILVGSSMGGWISLLLALARPEKIKGLVGIAAAPDFTEAMYEILSPAQKKEFNETGLIEIPTDYAPEPYKFTRKFYEDGKKNMILNKPRSVPFPMRFIQGLKDTDVPWDTAVKIQKTFASPDLDVVFIEDGDHRLSRPEDLELIDREVCGLCGMG